MTLHLLPPPPPTGTQDFETFWKAYPRKQAKGDARRAWYDTRNIRPPLERLLAAIQAQMRTDQWARGFVPNPANWLRDERWEDATEIQTMDPAELEAERRQAQQQAREQARAAWESLSPEERLRRIQERRRQA